MAFKSFAGRHISLTMDWPWAGNRFLGRSSGLMSTASILSQADFALKHSSYPALRRLSVDNEEGSLVIWGKVPSYFLKQLAQETIIAIRGPLRLVNRVDVVLAR